MLVQKGHVEALIAILAVHVFRGGLCMQDEALARTGQQVYTLKWITVGYYAKLHSYDEGKTSKRESAPQQPALSDF